MNIAMFRKILYLLKETERGTISSFFILFFLSFRVLRYEYQSYDGLRDGMCVQQHRCSIVVGRVHCHTDDGTFR